MDNEISVLDQKPPVEPSKPAPKLQGNFATCIAFYVVSFAMNLSLPMLSLLLGSSTIIAGGVIAVISFIAIGYAAHFIKLNKPSAKIKKTMGILFAVAASIACFIALVFATSMPFYGGVDDTLIVWLILAAILFAFNLYIFHFICLLIVYFSRKNSV